MKPLPSIVIVAPAEASGALSPLTIAELPGGVSAASHSWLDQSRGGAVARDRRAEAGHHVVAGGDRVGAVGHVANEVAAVLTRGDVVESVGMRVAGIDLVEQRVEEAKRGARGLRAADRDTVPGLTSPITAESARAASAAQSGAEVLVPPKPAQAPW